MRMDSLGKMVPAILFPYAQQWAERAGLPLLAELLVDEQFRSLFEKYGDEVMRRMAQGDQPAGNGHVNGNGHMNGNGHAHANGHMNGNGYANGNGHMNGNGHANGNGPPNGPETAFGESDTKDSDVAELQNRVRSMQAQQEVQHALFELLRSRIRPLALALGCCPECLVGVDGCPNCWGQSKVGHYPPDLRLLEAVVVNPLAARGAPLVLNDGKSGAGASERKAPSGSRPRESTTVRKRSKPCPTK